MAEIEYGAIVAGWPKGHPVPIKMGYDLSEKAGWFGRFAWRTLLKLRVIRQHWGTETVYRYRQVFRGPDSELMPVIAKIAQTIPFERMDRYALAMGRLDFMRLMGDDRPVFTPHPAGAFRVRQERAYRYRGQIWGLDVWVVDTMEGVVAIPKIVFEREER